MAKSYLIWLCKDYTNHFNELEAKFHKVQIKNWRHRAKHLKAVNRTLHYKVSVLQGRVNWYRARYLDLKEKNDCLRSKLARYARLEKALSECGSSHDQETIKHVTVWLANDLSTVLAQLCKDLNLDPSIAINPLCNAVICYAIDDLNLSEECRDAINLVYRKSLTKLLEPNER